MKNLTVKKPNKWKLKEGEWFYCIVGPFGYHGIVKLKNIDSIADQHMITSNNCFKTKKQAQAVIRKIKEVLRG